MTVTENTPDTDDAASRQSAADAAAGPADEVIDEVLIEEISIDGMCGVY